MGWPVACRGSCYRFALPGFLGSSRVSACFGLASFACFFGCVSHFDFGGFALLGGVSVRFPRGWRRFPFGSFDLGSFGSASRLISLGILARITRIGSLIGGAVFWRDGTRDAMPWNYGDFWSRVRCAVQPIRAADPLKQCGG